MQFMTADKWLILRMVWQLVCFALMDNIRALFVKLNIDTMKNCYSVVTCKFYKNVNMKNMFLSLQTTVVVVDTININSFFFKYNLL